MLTLLGNELAANIRFATISAIITISIFKVIYLGSIEGVEEENQWNELVMQIQLL